MTSSEIFGCTLLTGVSVLLFSVVSYIHGYNAGYTQLCMDMGGTRVVSNHQVECHP